ncbi:MAG: hypothetical protein ABI231_04165 [Candidatus Tumulicola sp.]
MRVTLLVAAIAGTAMLASPDALRSVLATSASALFEATPFLLAGVLISRIVRGRPAMAYLGCGCAPGPSARSLPAAAATWMIFGPAVAMGRVAAAIAVAYLLARSTRPHSGRCGGGTHGAPQPLGELAALLPAALMAGVAMQLASVVDVASMTPAAHVLAGALLGFAAAPCGLGAVAVAGALHARAPLAAASFLCVAGIVDLRALALRRAHRAQDHDLLAYVLLALALGIVGCRHGGALVHPLIAGPLLACGAAAIVLAFLHRDRQNAGARFAPAFMLAGALVAAPPPAYHATETTLTELFPGERLTFTGTVARSANAAALVRYAITCCRADAAPVVIRLTQAPAFPPGTWLRVDGVVTTIAGERRLVPQHVQRIAPPTDPFIYR